MKYIPKYKPQFAKDVKKYSSKKKQIEAKVKSIIEDPYNNSEPLEDRFGYNLNGIRSKRIDRNFRILFAICEECKELFKNTPDKKNCKYCEFDLLGLPVNTLIFYTVRPHKIVYKESKPL